MDARSCSILVDFLRYVEDLGLRTYDDLVIQNASDISRESDRLRVQKNKNLLQEHRRQEQKRQEQIHRLGFMTMPFPQDRAPSLGFSVRSQSLHSVQGDPDQNHWDMDDPANQSHWDTDDPTNQSLRKQPPPKPRRDPATKLSSSETEGLTEGLIGEKLPPPKPRRDPCTQLSSYLDQSLSGDHGDRRPLDQSEAASEEEPVYIEMGPKQNLDQDEGVYEEMTFTSESSPKPQKVPTPFPNLLSHKAPLLTLPQNQNLGLDQTSPQSSDESPLTPLEATLGQFFHQDLKSKTQKNPGAKAEARVRRTSDPVQDQERGLFKPDRRSEWSQSVDQIHPERGHRRDPRTRADFRDRRLDSEPDLRPDQRQYYSLRRDPTGRDHRDKRDLRDPRKGIRIEQRRERSLENLEYVLDQDLDQNLDRDLDFTVTSSGRASAPPLISRSGPSPIPQSYRRSQSACPSPVKRPPPYDVIMMSAVMSHGGHVTQRLRGPESGSTLRVGPTQVQTQVQTQGQTQDPSVHAQSSGLTRILEQ